MCNCGNTITTNSTCTDSAQNKCACPIRDLSTDCILYTGEDLPCTEIKQGTLLTDFIGQLDTYLCDLSSQLANSFSLIGIGSGTRVYRGVDGIGRKEIRSITSISDIISIEVSTDDKEIEIGIDNTELGAFVQDNQITYTAGSGLNLTGTIFSNAAPDQVVSVVGEGATVVTGTYPNFTVTSTDTTYTAGSGITLTGTTFSNTAPDQVVTLTGAGATVVTGTYPNFTVTSTSTSADGSETKINSGSSITVTGVGTTANPYIVNNSSPDQVVTLTPGGATTITGTYPNFTISSINTIADGSETKINNGTTTTVSGAGTIASPYIVEVVNLQKVISYPADFTGTNYTLTSADNNYSILINNASTAVTVTIPAGLSSKISVGFIQQGTADVSFVSSGTTINTPVGLRIKGQNYNAYIEKVGITETFHLLGNLKI